MAWQHGVAGPEPTFMPSACAALRLSRSGLSWVGQTSLGGKGANALEANERSPNSQLFAILNVLHNHSHPAV